MKKEVKSMKITFLPVTKFGKWSLISIVAVIVLYAFFMIMISFFGQRGGLTFFSNLWLAVPMILAWVAGCIAFIIGLTAIFKSKERSILVFVTTFVGFLITLYGVIEVLAPH
jgi:hypothetical protein